MGFEFEGVFYEAVGAIALSGKDIIGNFGGGCCRLMVEWAIRLIAKGFKGYFEGAEGFSVGDGNGGEHRIFVFYGVDLGCLVGIGNTVQNCVLWGLIGCILI